MDRVETTGRVGTAPELRGVTHIRHERMPRIHCEAFSSRSADYRMHDPSDDDELELEP